MNCLRVVSKAQRQQARDRLLGIEKAETRALAALAAERRRLPMFRIEKDYAFDGAAGKSTLADLTPFGRQEYWKDSPDDWPQTPPYQMMAPAR